MYVCIYIPQSGCQSRSARQVTSHNGKKRGLYRNLFVPPRESSVSLLLLLLVVVEQCRGDDEGERAKGPVQRVSSSSTLLDRSHSPEAQWKLKPMASQFQQQQCVNKKKKETERKKEKKKEKRHIRYRITV